MKSIKIALISLIFIFILFTPVINNKDISLTDLNNSDAYYGAIQIEFMRDIKEIEYPLNIHIDDTSKLEKLGLLGND